MTLLVTLDNLTAQIEDIINEYSDNVKKALEEKLDETAKSIIDYIKTNAPRSGESDALADSFTTSTTGEGINKVITIFSKSKGRIIHLLEFGYVHRSGKYVAPKSFMRPAYDSLTPRMLEDVKTIIENWRSL